MSLAKTSIVVGLLTLASRFLGFVRDLLIAYLLGAGIVAEAFFVAQRLPNLFRSLFAEGAFNNAFVPQFARRMEGDGKEAALDFAHRTYSVLFAWLLLFSVLAMAAMAWIVMGIAPGFARSESTLELTTELTRICFPYLLFISLVALLSGVLNSLGRFAAPALSPLLMNVIVIAFCLVALFTDLGASAEAARLLAYGVAASGVAQWLFLAALAAAVGLKIVPSLPRLTPEVKATLWLSVPGIISSGFAQINLAVATILASGMAGGVAYLYYAERLFELPLGVIGVTIGVVLLPTLSRAIQAGDEQAAQRALNRGLEFALFLTLPATAIFLMLPQPILHVVFERGAFHAGDTANVVPALMAFAVGLPAFTITRVLQPLFFARQDMKTPMYFALASVVANIVASLVLSHYYQHTGIALATSLAAWLNTILVVMTLWRQNLLVIDARLKSRLPRMVISLAVMCITLWLIQHFAFGAVFSGSSRALAPVWALMCLLAGAGTSYFLSAMFTKAMHPRDLLSAET